jgi:hypothetical protein
LAYIPSLAAAENAGKTKYWAFVPVRQRTFRELTQAHGKGCAKATANRKKKLSFGRERRDGSGARGQARIQ